MRDTIKDMGSTLSSPVSNPIDTKTLVMIGALILIGIFIFKDTVSVLADWMKQAAEKAAESI